MVELMVDLDKAGVAQRMRIIQKETKASLAALGDAGGGKTAQAAAKWLKTGRMGTPSMQGVASAYGYSFLWILTGQGPKRPQSIQDASVAGPGVPEGSLGRDLFQGPLMERAQSFAQAIIDAVRRGKIDDGAISALENDLKRLVANVEAARDVGIRIAAEEALRVLEKEKGYRMPDAEREEMLRDIEGRIRDKL